MSGGFDPTWLALREPADAAARAARLVDLLRAALRPPTPARPLVVHDLGCGTGSMGRWLAPRLPGRQHWVLHDRDPDLLAQAVARPAAVDGITTTSRVGDLTALTTADLAGADLVVASALLDLLTAAEVDGLAAVCVAVGCPTLLVLTVRGRVRLDPAPAGVVLPDADRAVDVVVAAAFDAHQRRTVAGRRLLGPDAPEVAAAAFAARGAAVHRASSPWRLGPDQRELTVAWLRGWVGAARELRPDLDLTGWLSRREVAAAAGHLAVVVEHEDLLVLPGRGS